MIYVQMMLRMMQMETESCESDEISLCQDATACNYNSSATDSDTILVYLQLDVRHVQVRQMEQEQ